MAILATINSTYFEQAMNGMNPVTLSSRFRIVIPRQVRQEFGLFPGDQFHVMAHAGRIELAPMRLVKRLRGFLKGVEIDIGRDKNRV